MASPSSASLNVIGLVSGGKDSFFSLLHCLAHGHRIVALANLHPELSAGLTGGPGGDDEGQETDLNSFMYQTVGHQVIPLYASATGLPLYRQPIVGRAVQHGRDYAPVYDTGVAIAGGGGGDEHVDETESMTTLLRRVLAAHPEANAVCAGAILSNYQRTRVESVAVRLGLISLAYLWKFPVLPFPPSPLEGSPYLLDLEAAGMDARIIKVASGGLDDALLWTNIASYAGRTRLQRALERFGLAGGGSALGEGGEYETLVVDGPRALFRTGSIVVAEEDRRVVQEGGGSAWLYIKKATVQDKPLLEEKEGGSASHVREPNLLDPRFSDVLAGLMRGRDDVAAGLTPNTSLSRMAASILRPALLTTWCIVPQSSSSSSIADAAHSVVDQVRLRLAGHNLSSPTSSIVRTLVVLRRMADFPAFNAIYATLFQEAPNPPARVTIACGHQLPAGLDVAVSLSVLLNSQDGQRSNSSTFRQGLHVQSRSYWAPANIGPYSQAVSIPVSGLAGDGDGDDGPWIVSVAGQIPLVPAIMELPDTEVEAKAARQVGSADAPVQPPAGRSANAPASFAFQATLALQHLWRIGIEVGVQWWSSAIAYVPREGGTDRDELALREKALLAAQAWRDAHAWQRKGNGENGDNDSDGGKDGPDLWDRKFDARYARFGGDGPSNDETTPDLPDWTVIGAAVGISNASAVPPVFLAEVQELPRSATVEWHAQAGFSRLSAGSIQCGWEEEEQTGATAATYRTIVQKTSPSEVEGEKTGGETVWQMVQQWPYPAGTETKWTEVTLLGMREQITLEMVYVDASVCNVAALVAAAVPLVPCASLWNEHGERLAAVAVWTAVHQEEL